MDSIEHNRYLDNYLDMFASDGWRTFIKELLEDKEDLEKNAVYIVKDERELYKIKGRLENFHNILSFESRIRALIDFKEEDDVPN